MQTRATTKRQNQDSDVDPSCTSCLADQLKPLGQIFPCRSCRNPVQKHLRESDDIPNLATSSGDISDSEALRIEMMEKLVHAMRSGTDEDSKALLKRLRQGIPIEELIATLPVVQASIQDVATVVREAANLSSVLDEQEGVT